MATIIGEKLNSEQIQIQFKDSSKDKESNKSMSFTVKNMALQDAYSKTLFMFKALAEGEEEVILTIYNTKNKEKLVEKGEVL